MIAVQHFGSISGGKDSQAVLCLMVERIERKGLVAFGNHAPRFYTMGMSRVGCSTCIMVKKRELRAWAMRFPVEVDRVREWERLVSLVSRRTAAAGTPASLLPAPTVPGDPADHGRAAIDRAIAWSRTTRGGRNYDLMVELEQRQADEHGLLCDSEYGLCE